MIPPIVRLSDAQVEYPQAVFCDVRYSLDGSDGYQAYLSGHIPGARYVSMDQHLAAPAGPVVGRHPLPTADQFARSLEVLGISLDSTVIAYDAVGGRFAGRMVWMLRILGQSAALLDGGLQAWLDEMPERPLQVDEPAGSCEARHPPWPEHEIVTADQVASAIAAGPGAGCTSPSVIVVNQNPSTPRRTHSRCEECLSRRELS